MSLFSSSPYGNPPNQLLSSLRHHAAGGASTDGLDQQQAAQNVDDRSSYASDTGSVTLPGSSRFGFRMRVKQFFKREHKDQDAVTPPHADATPSSVGPTWNINTASPAVHDSPVALVPLPHTQSSGKLSAAAPPVQVTTSATSIALTSTGTTSSATVPTIRVHSDPPTSGPLRLDIFPSNVPMPSLITDLPESGSRIDKTTQLAYCYSLLNRAHLLSSSSSVSDNDDGVPDQPLDAKEREWIQKVGSVEQEHLRQLIQKLVVDFSEDTIKEYDAVSEVVLLGPVLDQETYRALLSCFISKLEQTTLLDLSLLQGLIQVLQCASTGYVVDDDLVRIATVLSKRLGGTHRDTNDHVSYLTWVLGRVLDVMVAGKVKDLNRDRDHRPMLQLLDGLKGSDNAYVKYQAGYSYQALQYAPDDETPLQTAWRYAQVAAAGASAVSSVFKLDPVGLLEGLQKIGEGAVEGTKAIREGAGIVVRASEKRFEYMEKRSWYLALKGTALFIQQGRLSDFNQIVSQAPCRYNVNFQWGVCRQLGEIATNPLWDTSMRQQAVKFLGELYRSDIDWIPHGDVKRWILTILVQISTMPDLSIRSRASELLDSLRQDGATEFPGSYPLSTRLPLPAAFPLLTRVQSIPQVEYKLQTLKMRRLNDYKQAVYIPPMAKPSLPAPDDKLFPLMKNVEEFLAGEGQVMLILGDSGAGKSTFNRHLENQLWQDYKTGDRIPLFISLPSLERPERKLVVEQLRLLGFSEEQTMELKEHRHFILICDGYDESQLTTNLHTTNYLNQDGQWSAKLIITCRTQYLGPNYHSNFMPQNGSHYDRPTLKLFQEAVIAPFSKVQIEDYVEHYVPLEPRTWVKKDYMDKLTTIPNLLDLVKNPFLLTLCLEALPSVVKGKIDLLRLRVTRVQLYDNFVEHWLGVNKRRLERQKLSGDALAAYDELNEEGFEMNGLKFQQDLAAAIFTQQEGRPVVDYIHRLDKSSWKAKFFRPKPEETLLRGASLLSRAGAQYRFVHRSVLEYFYSCTICPSVNKQDEFGPQVHFDSTFTKVSISDHPLSRTLVAEPSIVHFLSERVPMNLDFKQHLHDIIELSKTNDQASRAAANAITILVKAGVLFNGADLRGIRVPGANLTDGQFDSAQLQCSDLTKVNFANSWIRKVDFSNARMAGVRFEELPYLDVDREVWSGAYSPDGKIFGVGFEGGDIGIYMYDTTSWNRIHTLQGHRDVVTALAFLETGRQLLASSWDKICSWDCETWQSRVIVTGHATSYFCYAYNVAFSPCGRFIATAGDEEESPDMLEPTLSFRLWDSRTSTAISELNGLDKGIRNLAFSPSGQVIAITYMDGTTRLSHTRTGLPGLALESENGSICCCAYSPGGQRIVSGHREGKITLWESATGKQKLYWEGHTGPVSAVSYSPNGRWIASSGKDDLIKLWDARSGSFVSVFLGNTTTVRSLVFAPDGTQLASISRLDTPIRLWEIDPTGEGPYMTHGSYVTHGSPISSMTYSPDGRSLVSGSMDGTIRQYDTASGDPIQVPSSGPFQARLVVISPDGRVASARETGSVTIWDAGTGLVDFVLCGHTETVDAVSFSPCGHWIATGSNDKSIRLWDSRTGQLCRTLSGHTDWVSSLGFSPDGLALVSGSMDGTLRIWDTSAGESRVLVSVEHWGFLSAAYSPDGLQIASRHFPSYASNLVGLSASLIGGLVILDQQTGEQRHILEKGMDIYYIRPCIFGPRRERFLETSLFGVCYRLRKWVHSSVEIAERGGGMEGQAGLEYKAYGS
ncbi:WD repeats region domain-containing protein [Linnemannia hyalina]|uniref:WD repeats region domain-containing protein n=1 Tax=Linnemannia hyalina TaxID=64524 RepID=A0A9P7XLE2_9FUNG|nr:WD repeats region domain-containing protein [Linnemannia hyalina]